MKAGAAALAALLLIGAAPIDPAATFDRVWETVERRYWNVDRLGERWEAARIRWRPQALAARDDAALYRALDGLLREVGDSHVFARDPTEVRFQAPDRDEAAEDGAFGFSSDAAPGGWTVFAVDPGGPAARAGVQIGWRLVSVDGRPVDQHWHARIGQRATLGFLDDGGRPRSLTLTAERLPDPAPRRSALLADGVIHLTLDTFERGADRWIRDEIEQAQPRAVVLDLRENYGGEAIAIARVAGAFFAEKRTLLVRQGRGKATDVPILGYGSRSWTGPLAVLVGPRSASGAELLAALVAESGRGATLGERTSGAVTGATLYDLPGGGQLSVAVFDIRTAGGTRLEGRGFTPAQIVRPTIAQLRAGNDPVLAAALASLRRS
ncbi:S41 family peptidase [Sphingomonas jatrophae]|uniref:C-terminal processing protease CtpA/Prc, contains a PDZ domain n=1 Tax=Sphingomonas jatrophae TaxID=1166337 RepID=A0A1I6JVX8_9SPHN|nr:S41 family peptidase [Sphingomonas jatrophae]SFR83096.1 C-terminal processing protease CtpA/Prc, contains a PDZ domain [Sphingomonas jatrophae]